MEQNDFEEALREMTPGQRRVVLGQMQWENFQEVRALRLRFKTERVPGEGGIDEDVARELYSVPEAKLERKLLQTHIQRYNERVPKPDIKFTAQSMLGEEAPKHIIGLLGAIATVDIGEGLIERFLAESGDNSGWLFTDQFEGHTVDHPPWTVNRDEASLKLQRFHTLVNALAKDPDLPQIWKIMNAMFRLVGYLTKMLRFIDKNNAHLEGRPALPDGSNIDEPALKAAWVLHRAWIRLLHYRSLSFGEFATGIDQLQELLAIARAQLERETLFAPLESRDIPEELAGFKVTLEILTFFLQTMANEFSNESVPKRGAVSPYILSDFNIDTDRVSSTWTQLTQTFGGDPPGTTVNPLGPMLLSSQLLDRAVDFDDRNLRFYVEDHLYENRIIAEDEWWEMVKMMTRRNYDPSTVKNRVPHFAKAKHAQALARRMSQVNLNRRNFLLLRDWSKKRPWKQLYWVFDTVSTDTWRQQIDDFYQYIERLKIPPEIPEGEQAASEYKEKIENDPESDANLFANIFPIHPIASHDPNKHIKAFIGSCPYCLEDLQPGELWLRFFCDHMLHYDCARAASWELHEVAGIVPECIDLWDNIDLVDTNEYRLHPIVSHEGTEDQWGFRELYWHSEATHLNMSMDRTSPRDGTYEAFKEASCYEAKKG
ncbi:hypothetical protein NHQ30_006937 [Ciborinia camelliae]|nr:hypothetical protein NHQ30_006937 [Ciborinia camelliae]